MDNHKKIYTIMVSEPWDFKSPDGDNIIRGIVLSIVNSRLLVFKANYLLKFDGISGDILILLPRLRDGNFEDIVNREIDVNGGLFLDDYNKKSEEDKLEDSCKFVLIGSLYG